MMSEPISSLRDLPYEATRVASGRIGRLFVAYVAAVVVVALVRTLGLVAEESWVHGFGRLIEANGWSSLFLVPVMTALLGFVAAAPFATAFLVVAEGRGVRTLLAYGLAGLVIAVATQLVLTLPFGFPAPSFGLLGVDAIAGGLGGWVGWMIGVRAAPPPPPLSWGGL